MTTATVSGLRLDLDRHQGAPRLIVSTSHAAPHRLIQGEMTRQSIADMRALLDEAEGMLAGADAMQGRLL